MCGPNKSLLNDMNNTREQNDSDEFDEDRAHGRRFVVDWNEIVNYGSYFEEYEKEALQVIENLVTYLPEPIIYMPHENFIRAAIANYRQGSFSKETCLKEVEFHCKKIRNDDIKKHGFAKKRTFDADDYNFYENYLPQFRLVAKARLQEFLEYEPPLKFSLEAETYLRQLFLDDGYFNGMPFCLMDYRAATIFEYRKYLALYGETEAEASPLLSLVWCDQTGVKKETLLPV